jgi:thiamine biosynthesis lipoprotein
MGNEATAAAPTEGAPTEAATETAGPFEARAMGSPLRFVVGAAAPEVLRRRSTLSKHPAAAADPRRWWRIVVDEFEAAEAAMSRFRDSSELTALNRSAGTGVWRAPSMRLRRALVAADRAHRVTGGTFDPRVLTDLERLGYRGAAIAGATPASPGADPARDAPGRQRDGGIIECHGRGLIEVDRPIDLGGIGKGLTLRWAAARLATHGAVDFMLEAGGDLVTRGRSPDGGPWQLGIEDPDGGPDPLAVIAVGDSALATSSTRVHRWTADGRPVHHLLDPRTGEPAEGGLAAVTVAGPDPAWAEVWSKVLFVGGRAEIAAEARSRGLAAWWVADDGALEMTPAARALTIWVAAEATEAG